jgi:hypothetical protein
MKMVFKHISISIFNNENRFCSDFLSNAHIVAIFKYCAFLLIKFIKDPASLFVEYIYFNSIERLLKIWPWQSPVRPELGCLLAEIELSKK